MCYVLYNTTSDITSPFDVQKKINVQNVHTDSMKRLQKSIILFVPQVRFQQPQNSVLNKDLAVL